MKALVLSDIGKLEIKEKEMPKAAEGQALIKIKACGICGSDIPRAYTEGAHTMPLTIGHELAGITEDGKRVGVYPLIPCMKCRPCKNRKYELCRSYSYLGSRQDGGFSQYALVPEWNLIELPQNVTMEQAAMLEPMAVVCHAIRRAMPDPCDNICVMGLGTIGMLMIMFLKEAGYKNIFAIGNKSYQRQKAIELGLSEDNICNTNLRDAKDWLRQITGGQGIDVFFECIGKNESVNLGIESAACQGTICLIGNPRDRMSFEKDTYWKILRNQLKLIGSWNSSFTHEADDDWHYVLSRLESGRISPEELISHRFGLDEIIKGFEIMRDKTQPYIKIIMSEEADNA